MMSTHFVDAALTLTQDIGTGECYLYRQRIFSAHEFLCMPLARQYANTTREKSPVEANLELGRLHKMLTLGKQFQGLFIDSPDEDVKRFSVQKSLEVFSIFEGTKRKLKPVSALEKVIKIVEKCNLTFPLVDPLDASPEKIAGAIARCCDSDWWRRQIRNHQDLILEHVNILLGQVHKKAGIYASDHCLQRKLQQQHRNEQILAGLEAENDLGQVFSLLELSKRGVSNPVNRRNEVMSRINGFEEVAKKKGDVSLFITLTAPSKYHSHLSKPCIPNPKYQGATPSDTQQYFNTNFKRTRAKLHRLGIQPYGFRVVEPHHDGTPHWHILFFAKPEDISVLISTIKHYALQEDGDEPGAQKYRVKVEHIDPKKGSAIAYIAKYIAKNIDGSHVGKDNYGRDAVDSAVRIRAWASNWNIRQFQQIGGPSVTVYRESRRFANQDIAKEILETIGNEKLKAIIEAADTSNWAAFVELSGGPTAPRNEQPLRALHVQKDSPSKYGEITKKILGIVTESGQQIVTRIRVWTTRCKAPINDECVFDPGFSVGGANAPPLEFCQ
jgi:hypothetical protein